MKRYALLAGRITAVKRRTDRRIFAVVVLALTLFLALLLCLDDSEGAEKIRNLPVCSALAAGDMVPVDLFTPPITCRATTSQLAAFLSVSAGAVTSVGLSAPSWLSVSGSPVTTTGTLAITAATGQTAGRVVGTCGAGTSVSLCALVAGDLPTVTIAKGGTGTSSTLTGLVRGNASALTAAELSGDATTSGSNAVTVGKINGVSLAGLATGIVKNNTSTGVPSIAVASDFPSLNQNTTGSAASLSATNDVAHGGTGVATLTAHGVVVGNGTGAVAVTGVGTAGQALTSNGAGNDPTFQTISGGSPSGDVVTYTTADQTVTSSTTLVTSMTVTLVASTPYQCSIIIHALSSLAGGGIYTNVDGTATMTNVRMEFSLREDTANTYVDAESINGMNVSTVGASNSGPLFLRYDGVVEVNAGGTFRFRWSQLTPSANATTVFRGSSIVCRRM